jgi:hypothetical protein
MGLFLAYFASLLVAAKPMVPDVGEIAGPIKSRLLTQKIKNTCKILTYI